MLLANRKVYDEARHVSYGQKNVFHLVLGSYTNRMSSLAARFFQDKMVGVVSTMRAITIVMDESCDILDLLRNGNIDSGDNPDHPYQPAFADLCSSLGQRHEVLSLTLMMANFSRDSRPTNLPDVDLMIPSWLEHMVKIKSISTLCVTWKFADVLFTSWAIASLRTMQEELMPGLTGFDDKKHICMRLRHFYASHTPPIRVPDRHQEFFMLIGVNQEHKPLRFRRVKVLPNWWWRACGCFVSPGLCRCGAIGFDRRGTLLADPYIERSEDHFTSPDIWDPRRWAKRGRVKPFEYFLPEGVTETDFRAAKDAWDAGFDLSLHPFVDGGYTDSDFGDRDSLRSVN